MLSDFEKRVVRELQGDLPVESRPFAGMAQRLGVTEERLLEVIEDLLKRGLMRRFGTALRHQQVGYSGNALVAWVVPEADVEKVGPAIAAYPEVTHCYYRIPQPGWPYTLYTMVHRHSRDECRELVQRIATEVGVERYDLLFSTKELKRSSMEYFTE